jgi:hypothetical protein
VNASFERGILMCRKKIPFADDPKGGPCKTIGALSLTRAMPAI